MWADVAAVVGCADALVRYADPEEEATCAPIRRVPLGSRAKLVCSGKGQEREQGWGRTAGGGCTIAMEGRRNFLDARRQEVRSRKRAAHDNLPMAADDGPICNCCVCCDSWITPLFCPAVQIAAGALYSAVVTEGPGAPLITWAHPLLALSATTFQPLVSETLLRVPPIRPALASLAPSILPAECL